MEEQSDLSSREELLKDEPSKEILCQETPSKDLPFDDLFSDEALPEDLSFEFEDVYAGGTLEEDPSPKDRLTPGTIYQDLPSEDRTTEGHQPPKHTSPEENLESEKDSKLPDIKRDIVKSLQAVMQWCDDKANDQNDIITNLKSQMPFIIGLVVVIVLLWVLKFIYG
jgi:hypothetical protein